MSLDTCNKKNIIELITGPHILDDRWKKTTTSDVHVSTDGALSTYLHPYFRHYALGTENNW